MALATYFWLLCLLVTAQGIEGAESSSGVNRWVTPPVDGANHDYTGNPQYTVGERVQLEWRTNATALSTSPCSRTVARTWAPGLSVRSAARREPSPAH